MATDTYAGPLGFQRIAGAAGGVSLSTTADFVPLFQGTQHVTFIPRNFTTAVVLRYIQCPYLVILKTEDALASSSRGVLNYSSVAQDGSTAAPRVDLSDLPTLANGGALWVGAWHPFRGVDIDVQAANSTANNLTVDYPSTSALTLTDIGDVDATDTGASLAQDGTVSWTVPTIGVTGWMPSTLRKIFPANSLTIRPARFKYDEETLFWTRWTWNDAMDSSTTLDHMLAMNESTAYAEQPVGIGLEQRISMGPGGGGISGYELLVDAGTGNVLVNCSTLGGYFTTGRVES